MKAASYSVVVDQDGLRGVVESGQLDGTSREAVVFLPGGEQVRVPVETLVLRETGGYFLPYSLSSFDSGNANGIREYATSEANAANADALVIPVIVEEAEIHKQWVERGRIRVSKTVSENEQLVRALLNQEQVEIERVPVNQPIEQPVSARYEGDTLIIPLVEEVLVVEKRLVLKEELRITKRRTQVETSQPVVLRSEDVVIERVDPVTAAPNSGDSRSQTT
ncbi:MAG: YsnF/AvaK domain-containing protein [bacterium]|nr:YsnF/AvaK domain-containing protein [bacterium]